ncbi:MAG: hypothetical protein OXD42_13365, partial [Rhodospirillaceae bacterium]|nr:hypothetical protein [Rhodospirillaceae bacterium]
RGDVSFIRVGSASIRPFDALELAAGSRGEGLRLGAGKIGRAASVNSSGAEVISAMGEASW